MEIFEPERMRNAFVSEQPPATRLGAEWKQAWVRAVHRNAQRESEVALKWSRDVGDEMAETRIGDQ